jgi:hypothetical protein
LVCTWGLCKFGYVHGLCVPLGEYHGYVHGVCVPWGECTMRYHGVCTWVVCTMGPVHGVCVPVDVRFVNCLNHGCPSCI